MAASLSDDEFQRIQSQILELRTENYVLSDKRTRQEKELASMRTQLDNYEKENQRLNKAVTKSKKAKEVDELLQECAALERKLHGQEQDFRLQNTTVMKELAQVMDEKDNLQRALDKQTAAAAEASVEQSEGGDELRRVQALNAALQKNMEALQTRHDTEVAALRQSVVQLEAQNQRLSAQRQQPLGGQTSDGRQVEGQSDGESEGSFEKIDPCMPDDPSQQAEGSAGEQEVHDSDLLDSPDGATDDVEYKKQITALQLQLDTELEEKRLLRAQLTQLEQSAAQEQQQLQLTADKVSEKFRKKQESYVQLQEEKEALYTRLSAQVQELEESRKTEGAQFGSQVEQLRTELAGANQKFQVLQQNAVGKVSNLEAKVKELQEARQEVEAGNEQRRALTEEAQTLKKACSDWEQNTAALRANVETLATQLEASRRAHEHCEATLVALQRERDAHHTALQDVNKLAEKRKSLLDELAIKYQTATDDHREATRVLDTAHRQQTEALAARLTELEQQVRQLQAAEERLAECRAQLTSVTEAREWLERRLKEAEERLEATGRERAEEVGRLSAEREESVRSARQEGEDRALALQAQHEQQLQKLKEEIEQGKSQSKEKEKEIATLKQEVKDGRDAKKVHEKKGMTMVRDLQKQLTAERRRAERLQERLQEYLQSDARSNASVEELLRPTEPGDGNHGDGSSVGSWSASALSAGAHSRDIPSAAGSPETEGAALEGAALDQELVARIAQLQQHNFLLQEKVSHLESSNAAMCDDLLGKSAIIEKYVRNSKAGGQPGGGAAPGRSGGGGQSLSLRRVMELVTEHESDDVREMNRKLQLMLEESLTKNMHLQQNIEDLSLELVRLSKQGIPPAPVKQPNK